MSGKLSQEILWSSGSYVNPAVQIICFPRLNKLYPLGFVSWIYHYSGSFSRVWMPTPFKHNIYDTIWFWQLRRPFRVMTNIHVCLSFEGNSNWIHRENAQYMRSSRSVWQPLPSDIPRLSLSGLHCQISHMVTTGACLKLKKECW